MIKKIKLWTVAVLLSLSSSLMASDYALTERYALMYDRKVAHAQQRLVERMQELLREPTIQQNQLEQLNEQFSRQLTGLMHGDEELRLHGTTLSLLRTKLQVVKASWTQGQREVNELIQGKSSYDQVNVSLHHLLNSVKASAKVYDESYARYKQRARLSAIVKRHSNGEQSKFLALNTVR